MQPRYQDIPSKDIPEATNEDGTVWAKIVAGEALGTTAVIDTVIPDHLHSHENEGRVILYSPMRPRLIMS